MRTRKNQHRWLASRGILNLENLDLAGMVADGVREGLFTLGAPKSPTPQAHINPVMLALPSGSQAWPGPGGSSYNRKVEAGPGKKPDSGESKNQGKDDDDDGKAALVVAVLALVGVILACVFAGAYFAYKGAGSRPTNFNSSRSGHTPEEFVNPLATQSNPAYDNPGSSTA